MRSGRHRSRPARQWVLDNPLLLAAAIGGLARLLSWLLAPQPGALHAALDLMWRFFGFGFRLAAGWLEQNVSGLPEWLALVLMVLVGLLIHLAGDAIWRMIRAMWRGGR